METLILNSNSKKDLQIIKEIALKFGIEILEVPDKKLKTDSAKKVSAKTEEACKLSHTPNAITLKTFKDTDRGIGLTRSKNTVDLFKKLGI